MLCLNVRCLLLSGISLFLFSSLSLAQSRLDSIQNLDAVVVSASLISKEIIPVQTLSGPLLEKLSSHSVADALRYFSGVQLKDYGGIGGLKTVNIRSMGSQHVGVFYDGIEIGNAQNGVVDLGRFSIDNMDAISLYNGQKSAIFQPAKDYASASSIYMSAKAPVFEGDKTYRIKTTFKTGAFDLLNPAIFWEQKLSKNVVSTLNTEYLYSSGKYKFKYRQVDAKDKTLGFDTTTTRKNGDIKLLRVEHALIGKVEGGEWKTRAYFYGSKRGYPGAVVKEEPGRFKHEDRQDDLNVFFQSSFKKRLTKKYTTLLSGKYAYDYVYYESDELSGVKVKNRYRLHEAYLSSANMVNILPFWSVNISADFQWNKLNANLAEFIYPQRSTTWVAAASSISFDQFKFQTNLLATYVHESMKGEKHTKKNWQKYSPTAIASWKPLQNHDLNLRAFYKHIFRMPTFSEIFYAVIGSGTSALRPENARQYNVGVTYAKNLSFPLFYRIEGQVDAYYNEITDKLIAMPSGRQFRWSMVNLGFVKIRGIDVALTANSRIAKDWLLDTRINYTYQHAQDYTPPVDDFDKENKYKNQIAYIPWHSGSAILNLSYKSWGLNYSFIYSGIRYTTSVHERENKIQAWYTHDMSVNKLFKWSKTDIRLTGEVNNVFNQQYEVVSRYPMPGTNLKFIINVTI